MAFGWNTEYEKRMPADGLSNWEVFAIAEQACKDLEWEYMVVDERTFTATTPTNWTLNEEIITVLVDSNTILFKSKSENIELLEAGMNQKNIEEALLPAFKKARERLSAEGLQNAALAIKNETLKQIRSGSRVDIEKLTFGFKGHEVTFFLLLVKLLVFIAMALKGVDVINPSTVDIIKWGGCVRSYVTGGEWWRLLTAIFVDVGVVQLLVNITALYFIGLMIEAILGKAKFLIAFLCAGVLANLITIVLLNDTVSTGSSGAIFGMYGVFLAFATTRYINKKFPKAWLLTILAYVAFTVFAGSNTYVVNANNVGGLVSGICIGYLFYFFHYKRNLARAGGTRVSVEIILVTALLIFLYIKNQKNDSIRFEKAIMKLNQIEVKAMTQMQQMQFAKSNEEAANILRDSTLPEWTRFRKELMKTDKYKLDEDFRNKRELLNQYSRMRMEQTELIYKSIKQETDKYNQQIEAVSDSIEKIIDKLGN